MGQLSTVGRSQSIRNATPLDLQSLRGGSWSGRYRIRRRGPVRRSRGGSMDGQACREAFRRSSPSELPPEREKAVFDN